MITANTFSYYGAAVWNVGRSAPVYGLEIGGETSGFLFGAGIELSYQTDSHDANLVLTPKAGLSLGTVNLFFGYNLTDDGNRLEAISPQQISLVVNLNKRIWPIAEKLP